ncbi:PAS domain-containing protein [Pseudomonas sp. E6002]|jgi:signal transduction histidine kinase|uniref:PAS domain-containing hybrid sensor histidine kinase/response regulator n=1 Tax=Pseudomonas sp. E6002 TaxID=2738820 RepID=UPI0015A3BDF7|nr:PAS domain-containing hybrid sensor histidine kinase/response regulator [Pseudomonas sp. E6002]NWB43331.1 PAS domain-containing protein [Pseudomonas sp. E6002]
MATHSPVNGSPPPHDDVYEEAHDLQFALSAAGLGIWRLDLTTGELKTSATCRLNFGLEPQIPFSYEHMQRLVHSEDRGRVADAWDRSIARRCAYDVYYRIVTPHGETRWLHVCARARYADDGQPVAMTGTVQDATQEQLLQSQKMEALGRITGRVAHDFNNLLTVIRSSADLLTRPSVSEERRLRLVQAISEAVKRGSHLTSQLLSFARRQTLHPAPLDVNSSTLAMADTIALRVGTGINVRIESTAAPCVVHVDPEQFETAILNMLMNARDAMPDHGEVVIRVESMDLIPASNGHALMNGSYVAVSITDNGSGIAPLNLDRIFEPFFSTKGNGQGTGLGLSQVFGFAKQSGGEIRVESRPGQGSTFTLYLPRA